MLPRGLVVRCSPYEPHFFQFRNTGLYALGNLFSYPSDNPGLYVHTDKRDVQIFDDAVYRKTDRFMLLFEKPR